LAVSQMLAERNQTHQTRRPLIERIQNRMNRNIITFFTSTVYPVVIEDVDNDMIEGMLQASDKDRGITLILNSLGGSVLAAERIINSCRTYSGGDFEVVVLRTAKSAATMICLGANKIWMSRTAELGPIDPQVVIVTQGGRFELRAAYYIIDSYKKLFEEAVSTTGNIQPYLQQLDRYDARDIREYEKANELGEDIAVRSLMTGRMKNTSESGIKEKIQPFINPTKTKTHGRPIYIDQAREAGLIVEEIDIHSEEWTELWELYLRSSTFVNSTGGSKLCESLNDSFIVPVPRYGE
jgi:ClpP class serine protease